MDSSGKPAGRSASKRTLEQSVTTGDAQMTDASFGEVFRSTDARRLIRRDALMIFGFLLLAASCFHRNGPLGMDRWVLRGYVASKGSLTFRIAEAFTTFGSPGVVVVLGVLAAVLVWFRRRSLPWAVACLAAPGAAGLVEATLKIVIGRPRPLTAALTGESGNGFPSGHAAGFAAFACVLAFVLEALQPNQRRRIGLSLAALSISALMALSRVLVGAHYPTDVVGGLLVGVVTADIVAFLACNWSGFEQNLRGRKAL